jgi:hypothetical protein
MLASASKVESPPIVPQLIAKLHDSLDILFENVGSLEVRLMGIMVPSEPTEETVAEPMFGMSPVSESIKDATTRVRSLAIQVGSLRDRTET